MAEQHVFSVTELNRAARGLLESTYGEIWLRGEIAEMKRAPSGHLYFTLKDEDAEISAVRFRSRSSSRLGTPLIEPGMVVLAFGRLTVYEPRGRYQFVASLLQPMGAGALQAAFEALKKRLAAEGLFDPSTKASLPRFPGRIGVITSAAGAAFHDICSVLDRRWPVAEILLFPSSVQGATAPAELVAALETAQRYHEGRDPLDLLIVGRGGGSAEDLMAFNDESVARALHGCPIPTVSAVGHEVDFSISDFVSDVRAATPSAAAEVATPNRDELRQDLIAATQMLRRSTETVLRRRSDRLSGMVKGYLFRVPQRLVETYEQQLDHYVDRCLRSTRERMRSLWRAACHLTDLLRVSDPRLPLRRGYSMTRQTDTQELIRRADQVVPGMLLETLLEEGRLTSRVEEVSGE